MPNFTFKEIKQKFRMPRIHQKEKKLSWMHKTIYTNIGVWITKLLLPTAVTPNQVTFFALIIGVFGSVLFIFGKYYLNILAILLVQFSLVLDFVDGTLARAKGLSSSSGDYLDRTISAVTSFFMFACLGLGNYQRFGLPIVLLGFLAGFSLVFLKFAYATRILSVINCEKVRVYESLNMQWVKAEDNKKKNEISNTDYRSKTRFIKRIFQKTERIFNYLYLLNFITLFVIFNCSAAVLVFYGITLPLYAFFGFVRLSKVDSQEFIAWIVDSKGC